MKNAGILADRDPRSPSLEFRQYNLIYGFNGSGKSTLSRIFASLEAGKLHAKLPADCSFEVRVDEETGYGFPENPNGLEKRLVVFNADYIEQNLQWQLGRANPVFLIGTDQAEAAAQLVEMEALAAKLLVRKNTADAAEKAAEKVLATFKRERAKMTASRLHLGNRKYEAPALAKDFDSWAAEQTPLLTDVELQLAEDTRRLQEPMPELRPLAFDPTSVARAWEFISEICSQSLSIVALAEAERFPEMVLWLKQGSEFHETHELGRCLLCDNPFAPERKALLAMAIDNRVDEFAEKLSRTADRLQGILDHLAILADDIPSADRLGAELRPQYDAAAAHLVTAIRETRLYLQALGKVLAAKQARPASPTDLSILPEHADVDRLVARFVDAIASANALIANHNLAVGDFTKHKEQAEVSIRKHFVALACADYEGHAQALDRAITAAAIAGDDLVEANTAADTLRQKIKAHGPAAEAINKLIASYLGHTELTIHAVDEGYELHRHGNVITGIPSEGEKTAIAIAYFLSSIEAEARKLKDVIVVVDDPVSSLDTKALNYACALVRSRLGGARQLFVLTHNQQCMNEFRKAWKNKAKPSDDRQPTANLMFIDVIKPEGQDRRSSRIVEMSRLLREYDSEYHYLFSHVLSFVQNRGEHYDYGYMMPNVIRRVLDTFLAFRCPGSAGLVGQIEQLCKEHPDLDREQLAALERLSQVESHSDNLDDLLSFSSMTLEEARNAASVLLDVIGNVDNKHLAAVKRLCR